MAAHFASRTARPAPGRSRHTFYYGAWPLTRMLTDWVRRHKSDALETGAAALMRQLSYCEDREPLVRNLVRLQEQGSRLATFCVAVNKISGHLLPRAEQEGRALLLNLAKEGFDPAFAALLEKVTLRDLKGQQGPELMKLVSQGAARNVEFCVLLYARAWLEGLLDVSYTRGCQLVIRLLGAARDGCWDALDLLLELAMRLPANEFPGDYVDGALDVLRIAAASHWPEAMYKYGFLYCHGHFVSSDFRLGLMWLERAWKAGNLDAGCLYAELAPLLCSDKDTRIKTQQILEECCKYMHPQALALMGELFMDEKETREAGTSLLVRAAELGHAEPLVTMLWQRLLKMNLRSRNMKHERLLALSRPPLDRALCARHKRALYILMLPVDDQKRHQCLQELKNCAMSGYGPAASTLAELYGLGLWRVPKKEGQFQKWLAVASRLHEPRALSLKILQEFETLRKLPADRREQEESDLFHLLEWACRKNDLLAVAITMSMILHLNDAELARRDRKYRSRGPSERSLQDIYVHCADMLGYLQTRAMGTGDLAVFVFLSEQFMQAALLGLHDDFARYYCDTMGVCENGTCFNLAEMFLFCAERLGEPEAEDMGLMVQKLYDLKTRMALKNKKAARPVPKKG